MKNMTLLSYTLSVAGPLPHLIARSRPMMVATTPVRPRNGPNLGIKIPGRRCRGASCRVVETYRGSSSGLEPIITAAPHTGWIAGSWETVEMRGIEPRSDVASMGLLRAQFMRTLLFGSGTCINTYTDEPSHVKVPPAPATRASSSGLLSRCQ